MKVKTCKAGLHQYDGKQCRECQRKRDSTPERRAARRERLRKPEAVAARRERLRKSTTYRAAKRKSVRKWRQNNPEIYLAIVHANNARRRARKAGGAVEPFTLAQWEAVIQFYGHSCAYCGLPFEATGPRKMTEDHWIPIAKGGAHAIWNVVPACAECNGRKLANLWRLPVDHPLMFADVPPTLSPLTLPYRRWAARRAAA